MILRFTKLLIRLRLIITNGICSYSRLIGILALICLIVVASSGDAAVSNRQLLLLEKKPVAVLDPQDTFPVPTGIPYQLFYLQRTSNTNTIVIELNADARGRIDESDPVHVFWIRYPEGGMKKELSYIQRTFAYGIKSKLQADGSYELHFVSYKKQKLYLKKSFKDNRYHVYTNINQKTAVLSRIFIKIDGGSFWSPNIVYMELKGVEESSGKPLLERFKP